MGSLTGGRWRIPLLALPGAVAVTALSAAALVILPREGPDDRAGLAALTSTSADLASLPVTVPFDYVDGRVVIDVAIGDVRPTMPMVLDSGAPTIVSAELAEAFGEPAGTASAASVDGRTIDATVVALPEVHIGGARFRDVGALSGLDVTEPGNPLACLGEHGFIGANLMEGTVWQIDYGARQLTIALDVSGLDHIEDAIRLDLFDRASAASSSPIVELPAGDGRLRLLVDTGSDGWLAVHPADLRATGSQVAPDAPAIATLSSGVGGSFVTRLVFSTVDLRLGDRTLTSLPVATSEALREGHGNLGNEFLSHFVVTIDWVEDVIYLDPVTDAIRPEVPQSATVTWQEGYVLGSLVEDAAHAAGSAANHAPEPGAPILAIDGEDVTAATFDDFCASSTARAGAPHEITVSGDPPTAVAVAPVEGFFAPLGR